MALSIYRDNKYTNFRKEKNRGSKARQRERERWGFKDMRRLKRIRQGDIKRESKRQG